MDLKTKWSSEAKGSHFYMPVLPKYSRPQTTFGQDNFVNIFRPSVFLVSVLWKTCKTVNIVDEVMVIIKDKEPLATQSVIFVITFIVVTLSILNNHSNKQFTILGAPTLTYQVLVLVSEAHLGNHGPNVWCFHLQHYSSCVELVSIHQ